MKLETITRTIVGLGIAAVCATAQTAKAQPCTQCGPGAHWTDSCLEGTDQISDQGAVIGIDLDLDCVADISLVLGSCGTLQIYRSAPVGHDIDTEILDLCLSDGSVTLIAGAGLGQGGVLAPSLGTITEQGGDPALADSSFDVMFEVDLGGGYYVYNHAALVIQAEIDCVPPQADYIHPTGCLALFDDPVAGTVIANLVSAQHSTYPICGDNVINRPGEECDGTEKDACEVSCEGDCTCTAVVCGNNIAFGDEECDGTDDDACPGMCEPDCTCLVTPALPIWGIVGLGVLLAAGGATAVARRRKKA